jgi:hypothetical protein
MDNRKNSFQLLWGAALTAAGIGVFVILPHRMAQIQQLRQAEPFDFDMLFPALLPITRVVTEC